MAYVNATIDQGGFGSFVADASDIAIYAIVKFTTTPNTVDASGKPTIAVAGATDRAVGVAMQPISAGKVGTIRFLNAQGEQFGLASGSIGLGVPVYQATGGKLTASSGGGAYLAGISTTPGYDGGVFTYMPVLPTA